MPSDASAARRQFQRGGILQYFCLVQNSAAKRHPADIGAQLRVVRDDKQVLLLPVRVERLADDKQAVSGQLNLSAMPAGDYFVQVIATGRGAGK